MGDVLKLVRAQKAPTQLLTDAWYDYLQKQSTAQQALELSDGIAAGKAFSKFLHMVHEDE